MECTARDAGGEARLRGGAAAVATEPSDDDGGAGGRGAHTRAAHRLGARGWCALTVATSLWW